MCAVRRPVGIDLALARFSALSPRLCASLGLLPHPRQQKGLDFLANILPND